MDSGDTETLVERLDEVLPQTQCTRCGYPDCRAYAWAIAHEQAAVNRCPPGGAEGVLRLAAITATKPAALDPQCGHEGPLRVARVDEAWCIGCTLCIKACPVDCIVGAPQRMHSVVEDWCTGCERCLPACPVDCIVLIDITPGRCGWAAWGPAQARQARQRYATHRARLAGEAPSGAPPAALSAAAPPPAAALTPAQAGLDGGAPSDKSVLAQAALARARARRLA